MRSYGESVDSHDVVMRMNQAPTRGYVDKVGRKTTHRLLNRLWTLAYTNDTEIRWPYRTKEVIQVRERIQIQKCSRPSYLPSPIRTPRGSDRQNTKLDLIRATPSLF